MDEFGWNAPTDSDTAARRAGGRRHYNSKRQHQAMRRRLQMVKLLEETGFLHGAQTKIAKMLGMHRSTICRDLQYFDLLGRGYTPEMIFLRRQAERGRY